MNEKLKIWDPHFHIWNVSNNTATGQQLEELFAPDGDPIYTVHRYERDCDDGGDAFEHIGGTWLEVLSVCQVGKIGRAYIEDCRAEYLWACEELARSDRGYVLVPSAPLEEPAVGDLLAEFADNPKVRGVRQILNHQPDWPRITHLGDLLTNSDWHRGYAALEKHGLSFDLMLNPNQYRKAADLIKDHPGVPVVINHLGSPTLADLTKDVNQFRKGIEALADCRHTTIKLSMLYYAAKDWDRQQAVIDALHFVIETFGTDRCFFATNYPLDVRFGWPAAKLYAAWRKLIESQYEADVLRQLFAENAMRAYGVEHGG